jgi:Arc/MetJ family transcription regulator
MRTTVTLDDALYEKALEMADPDMDKSDIFREAMKTFVRVQAAKRLAALGGTMPEITGRTRRSGLELLPRQYRGRIRGTARPRPAGGQIRVRSMTCSKRTATTRIVSRGSDTGSLEAPDLPSSMLCDM